MHTWVSIYGDMQESDLYKYRDNGWFGGNGGSCGWDGACGQASGIAGKVLTLDLGGSYRHVSFGTVH